MSHANDCAYRHKGECDCTGSEDYCPGNENGEGHVPDWATAADDHDGTETYIDVNCRYCGRSGCLGTARSLEDGACW